MAGMVQGSEVKSMASTLDMVILNGDEEVRFDFNVTAGGNTFKLGFQGWDAPYDQVDTSIITQDRAQLSAMAIRLEAIAKAMLEQLESEEVS